MEPKSEIPRGIAARHVRFGFVQVPVVQIWRMSCDTHSNCAQVQTSVHPPATGAEDSSRAWAALNSCVLNSMLSCGLASAAGRGAWMWPVYLTSSLPTEQSGMLSRLPCVLTRTSQQWHGLAYRVPAALAIPVPPEVGTSSTYSTRPFTRAWSLLAYPVAGAVASLVIALLVAVLGPARLDISQYDARYVGGNGSAGYEIRHARLLGRQRFMCSVREFHHAGTTRFPADDVYALTEWLAALGVPAWATRPLAEPAQASAFVSDGIGWPFATLVSYCKWEWPFAWRLVDAVPVRRPSGVFDPLVLQHVIPMRVAWRGVCLSAAFYGGAFWALVRIRRYLRTLNRLRTRRCVTCGYAQDRIAPSRVCPECGSNT